MFINLEYHLISKACFLFSNSTVKVHDSQAYRNMEMNQFHIWSKKPLLSVIFLYERLSGLCNPWENLRFKAIVFLTER